MPVAVTPEAVEEKVVETIASFGARARIPATTVRRS